MDAMCLLRQHARQEGGAAESLGTIDASRHGPEAVPIVAADMRSDMDLSVSGSQNGCAIFGEGGARLVLRQGSARVDGQLP